MRFVLSFVLFLITFCSQVANAQTPGTVYTWPGTGDTRAWNFAGTTNTASFANTIAGQLTVKELGLVDELSMTEIHGGAIFIRDDFNRVRESSSASGGLDLTGLDFLEMDVSHNGTGNINVQFYIQAGINGEVYTWANLPDHNIAPNTVTTMQFPLSALTAEQRTYIRNFGMQVRDHQSIGDVTWTISDVRSLGTPLTVRDIATHDVGTSDNGFNGVYANFDLGADPSSPSVVTILGSDGGQNQTGFTQNTSGSGSLQWTDRGGAGTPTDPSGAAITWGNGTALNGNAFFERPTDVSNYNRVTFRMSATDVTPGGGGSIGIQSFFQTGNFDAFQVAGVQQLPVDGAFHDLVFSLGAVTNRQIVQAFGVNLFAHPNNVVMNVDLVRFSTVAGVTGDYNDNGVVDAADYALWRDKLGQSVTLPNDSTPGTVTAADYDVWKANFAKTAGSGSGSGNAAVPEPGTVLLMFSAVIAWVMVRRRGV